MIVFVIVSVIWAFFATLAIRELNRRHDALACRVSALEEGREVERQTVAGLDAGLGKVVIACHILAKAQGFNVGETPQPTLH